MKKIIFSALMVSLALTGCSLKDLAGMGGANKTLSMEEAQTKALDFINGNLMSPDSPATITEITDEGSLYKIMVDVGSGEDVESYISKDGTKFFPQVLNIEEIEKQVAEQKAKEEAATTQAAMDLEKTETPNIELFVMSHCPFGTQIEKGLLPVLDLLGNDVNFELKFCDYAMHGKKELDEQLNQYCIQKNEPEKLLPYLKCFLAEGDGEGCLDSVGVNKSQVASCASAADKEYKVTEQYDDKSTWRGGSYPLFDVFKDDVTKYGVSGSPTLVVNGKVLSAPRDSASLLNIICGSFSETPEACDNNNLSPASPSAGFGFDEGGSATTATCN